MKKLFPAFGLLAASLGLIITSGIFAGGLAKDDDFVDPIEYAEAPARNALVYEGEEEEEVPEVDKVIVHYHNDDGKNNTRRFYFWVTGVDGAEYQADVTSGDKKDMSITLDYNGKFADFKGQEGLYLIIKYEGTWNGQSEDTFVSFLEYEPVEKVVEFWIIPGTGNSLELCHTEEETKSDRVTEAFFKDFKNITVKATAAPDVYRLYAYEQKFLSMSLNGQAKAKPYRLLKTGSASNKNFNIALSYNAHINVQYVLETEYKAWPGRMHSLVISFSKLYTNSRFQQYYEYKDGKDLGVTYTKDSSTFKLWAPTSGIAYVNIYNKGTTKGDDPTKGGYGGSIKTTYLMSYMAKGVWAATIDGDLNGKYYTYTIFNSNGENEVVDPYAHACGANGKRGMILDFSTTNPEGWKNIDGKWDGKSGYDITTPQQLSIYEAHIRDLTMHETWTGKEKRGTYLAFAEKGTTYTKSSTTVKTGFDHIEELGVNAIQFTPVFDHDNIEYFQRPVVTDEGTHYELDEGSYNWGYNPLNYNCVEGQYSSNPNDGALRVKEYKQLIYTLATSKNKIRTIMDVVYNHVSSGSNSNFTKIMPGYYFRLTTAGEYYNGSGCGNEVKTEAPMMRKFIVESLCWWAKEYNVKGFRFDLMGLIDYVTLKEAATELYKIDPDIVLYGEGWTGDGSDAHIDQKTYNTCGANTYVTYRDLKSSVNYKNDKRCIIACFNDYGRNALKGGNDRGWGDTTRLPGYGFMSQGSGDVGNKSDEVGWLMLGKNNNNDVAKVLPTNVAARMTVNYASCHDNYSLFDQFSSTLANGSTKATPADIAKASTTTNIAIMLSNGIAFMQGGEELFRTKIVTSEDAPKLRNPEDYVKINGLNIAHNAYKCSDPTNAFDYSRKIALTYQGKTESGIYNKYFTPLAKVIALRSKLVYKNDVNNSGNANFWGSGDGKSIVGYYIKSSDATGGYVVAIGGRSGGNYTNSSKTVFATVGTASATGSKITVSGYSSGVYAAG